MSEVLTFGELSEGDKIMGSNGEWVTITKAYKNHIPQRSYEIGMEDGTVITASGNHLWYIETDMDKSLHSARIRESKKILKGLIKEEIALLESYAFNDTKIGFDLSFKDAVDTLDANKNRSLQFLIKRVLESIGPISENNYHQVDIETMKDSGQVKVQGYDAQKFAQQVLSLTGKRTYTKKWPVIVGRVVTTDELVYLAHQADIPTVEPVTGK